MSASKRPTPRRLLVYAAGIAALILARPGWATLFAGSVLVTAGVALRLWATGYLSKNRRLTREGPYRHLRHPLYLGTWLIATGILVACIGPGAPLLWLFVLLIGFQTVFFAFYMRRKEAKEADRLQRNFGDEFVAFRSEVPAFLPRLRPAPLAAGAAIPWSVQRITENSEWETAGFTRVVMVFLGLRCAGVL